MFGGKTTIQDLPLEILTLIAQYFDPSTETWNNPLTSPGLICQICQNNVTRPQSTQNLLDRPELWTGHSTCLIVRHVHDVRALAYLARTTRPFNIVITPLLYRSVRLFGHDVRPFVRALCLNPKLRFLVKKLSLEFRAEKCGAAEKTLFLESSVTHCARMALSSLSVDLSLTESISTDLVPHESWTMGYSHWGPVQNVASVLLLICPCVEYLRFQSLRKHAEVDPIEAMADIRWYRLLHNLLALPCMMHVSSPGLSVNEIVESLPKPLATIQTLVLEDPCGTNMILKLGHAPALYWDVCDIQHISCLPSLKSLSLSRADDRLRGRVMIQPQSSLKHLTIKRAALKAHNLAFLIRSFPNLTSIEYQVEEIDRMAAVHSDRLTRERIDPRLIVEAFISVAATLEIIVLETGVLGCDWWSITQGGTVDGMDGVWLEDWLPNGPSHDYVNAADSWFEELIRSRRKYGTSELTKENQIASADVNHISWLTARLQLAKCVKTVDLRSFVSLKSVTLEATSLVGWAPEWIIGLPHEMTRIAHILPSSIQALTLKYSSVGWIDEDDDISFSLGRTSFDHIRDLIKDAGQPSTGETEEVVGIMVPELSKIVLQLHCWAPEFVWNQLQSMRSSAALKGIDLDF